MELKTFISETLTQILEGVTESQSKASQIDGRVVPHVRTPREGANLYGHTNDQLPVIVVDFDVSVFAQEDTGTKGGIGIAIGVLALGSKGESNQQQNSTNKIKFQIPIALPLQVVENNKQKGDGNA